MDVGCSVQALGYRGSMWHLVLGLVLGLVRHTTISRCVWGDQTLLQLWNGGTCPGRGGCTHVCRTAYALVRLRARRTQQRRFQWVEVSDPPEHYMMLHIAQGDGSTTTVMVMQLVGNLTLESVDSCIISTMHNCSWKDALAFARCGAMVLILLIRLHHTETTI